MQEERRRLKRSESGRSRLDFRIWAWTCLRWVRLLAKDTAVERVAGVLGYGFGWGGRARVVWGRLDIVFGR